MTQDQHQRLGRLSPENCALLICDLQEQFRPAIYKFDQIVANTNKLIEACSTFNIPIVATEQYPKGLGKTVPEIKLKRFSVTPIAKTCFTMALPEVTDMLKTKYPKDFLDLGYTVHIMVDCSSSRNQVDRIYAYDRAKQMGAFLNTSESVILSLTGDSRVAQFKRIQKIIHEGSDPAGLAEVVEREKEDVGNKSKL